MDSLCLKAVNTISFLASWSLENSLEAVQWFPVDHKYREKNNPASLCRYRQITSCNCCLVFGNNDSFWNDSGDFVGERNLFKQPKKALLWIRSPNYYILEKETRVNFSNIGIRTIVKRRDHLINPPHWKFSVVGWTKKKKCCDELCKSEKNAKYTKLLLKTNNVLTARTNFVARS